MTLPPASTYPPIVPRPGMSEVTIWNTRLRGSGHPDLYFRPAESSGGIAGWAIERVIPPGHDFSADPETIAWGETFHVAWNRARQAMEHDCRTAPHAGTTPAAGGHGRPGRFPQTELFR